MDETIPFIDRLGDELVRAIARTPHRVRAGKRRLLLVAAALLLFAAAPAVAMSGWSLFAPTRGQLEAEQGGTLLPESFRILRTVEQPPGITWTVVAYETTKYKCLDVYGSITGSEVPAGAVGGCGGLPELSQGQVIVGGLGGDLRVGTNSYSVVGGLVAHTVAMVRATFADGSMVTDRPGGGVWLFVSSAERPTIAEALNEQGEVLSVLELSS